MAMGVNEKWQIGPWLVTKDEILEPQALKIWLAVNNQMRQDCNTGDMIFNVKYLASYISKFITLLPGDVILTGTPGGVGLGRSPPEYLKIRDVIRLGIAGLGEQTLLVSEEISPLNQ